MKIRAAITALILGLSCSPALWAQSAPAQKVGVIMYFRALVECTEGKVANDEFQKKLEGRKNELQKKQTEIQTLQQQLEAQRQTLNEDSLAALSKNIQVKTTELQRLQEDAEKEFGAMRNDILERIGRKMGPIVQKYAQEKAFSLLLDGSTQGSQLIFVNSTIDVTDDIIKRYDTAYPVTGAVPATPAAK
jgi:outer membrane protein